MTTVTATDVQNNFSKYLQYAINGNEVIILKSGKEVARLISREQTIAFLTDSLRGILHSDYNEKELRRERIEKHEGLN